MGDEFLRRNNGLRPGTRLGRTGKEVGQHTNESRTKRCANAPVEDGRVLCRRSVTKMLAKRNNLNGSCPDSRELGDAGRPVGKLHPGIETKSRLVLTRSVSCFRLSVKG